MIKISLSQGKQAILPKVDKENKMLKLYEIKAMSELMQGYMGILEPSVSEERLTGLDDIDLIIIPVQPLMLQVIGSATAQDFMTGFLRE